MIQLEGKYYLYRHVRLDKNEVFYIGIGIKRVFGKGYQALYYRAYDRNSRSKHWKNIAVKGKYTVEILLESNSSNFIKEKEREFIKLYGRKDLRKGTLVNFTDGGEGSFNIVVSIETRKKMSEKRRARKVSEETGRKISEAKKGKKMSKEFRENCSRAFKGRILSEEHKRKISESVKRYRESRRNVQLI